MRDHGIWSISLGRWNAVQVRLHMLFLVFAVVTLYFGWTWDSPADSGANEWLGLVCVGILLASVMVHELGHVLVANRMGAGYDEVVLGPLGGFGPPPSPLETHGELLVATAGPLANLGVCFAAALGLALHGDVNLIGLMNPFAPEAITSGTAIVVGMKLTFWINWVLILANLIPAYPFDGGVALRSILMLTNANVDAQHAAFTVAKIAKVTAVALLIVAWMTRGAPDVYQLHTWFALIMLAIFVYFSAKKEETHAALASSEEAFLGYDFSAGYTSLEQSGPRLSTHPRSGPIVRWLRRRRELRERRKREIEVIEDGRVDEILLKLHESGMESLTPEDHDLLKRVSVRYRNRSDTSSHDVS